MLLYASKPMIAKSVKVVKWFSDACELASVLPCKRTQRGSRNDIHVREPLILYLALHEHVYHCNSIHYHIKNQTHLILPNRNKVTQGAAVILQDYIEDLPDVP